MPAQIPDEVPTMFSAGETVKFRRSFADFPASEGWKYAFHMNGATATLHRDGEVDGEAFTLTINPSDALPEGAYRYIERVEKDGEVHNVRSGVLEVELDLATAPAGATLTHAERTLQVIEQVIEGRLPVDLQQYTIAGRVVTKIPIEQLLRMRGTYKAIVCRQHNPGKLGEVAEVTFSEVEERTIPPTWEESLR